MKTTQSTTVVVFSALVALGAVACGAEGMDESAETEEVFGSTQSALTTTYQAEAANNIEEGVIESIHSGFTGTGYVNIDNFSDTFFLHVVNSGFAGAATLQVRYANGSGSNRAIRVTVNGVTAGTITGAPTGSWSTWATASVSVNLLAGNNDVVHSSVSSDGMPNIDRFQIVQTVTQTFQAEAANNVEEGVIESIHSGFTGSGYVNIDNFSDTFFLHVVNSPVTAAASLTVRYANGGSTNRGIRITVNGVTAGTLTGAPTGSWTTWVSASVPVNLIAGNNDIVHSSVSSDGMPNIDRFQITY